MNHCNSNKNNFCHDCVFTCHCYILCISIKNCSVLFALFGISAKQPLAISCFISYFAGTCMISSTLLVCYTTGQKGREREERGGEMDWNEGKGMRDRGSAGREGEDSELN